MAAGVKCLGGWAGGDRCIPGRGNSMCKGSEERVGKDFEKLTDDVGLVH